MGPAAHGDRRPLRILAAIQACYLDFSNGAATSIRDLLVALAARGHACRVLCGPRLDTRDPGGRILDNIARMGVPVRKAEFHAPAPHTLLELDDRGVHSSIVVTPEVLPSPAPRAFGDIFLGYYGRLLRTFCPDVVLTFGDGWIERETLRGARLRGVPIAYLLCNYGYRNREMFRGLHTFTCSGFLTRHYHEALGLESTPLAPLCDPARVLASEHAPRFLTFVSPMLRKGAYAVARIVAELARRRPDIPVLVVQGRGDFNAIGRAGLDLTELGNLHAMWTTEEARDFYRVTRVLLMPSLAEPFGMVAVEALANGIPVLGARRGGLVEALQDGGFLLDPLQQSDQQVPDAAAVEPWLRLIERLWDDPAFYAAEQARARAGAARFGAGVLAPQYEQFFAGLARWPTGCEQPAARTWFHVAEQPREVLTPPTRRPRAKIETLKFRSA